MKVCWIDLESTGLDPDNDTITELAVLYENYAKGNSKDKQVFHIYGYIPDYVLEYKERLKEKTINEIQSNNQLSKSEKEKLIEEAKYECSIEKVENLNGLTREFLKEHGVSQKEIHEALTHFLGNKINKFDKLDKAIFAAYCANFDVSFLRKLFLRNKDNYFNSWFYSTPLDIPSIYMLLMLLGETEAPENFKNITVAKALGIKDIDESKLHLAIEDIKISRGSQLNMIKRLKEWGQQKNVS